MFSEWSDNSAALRNIAALVTYNVTQQQDSSTGRTADLLCYQVQSIITRERSSKGLLFTLLFLLLLLLLLG
jgi:hypothetical protein